MGKGHGGSGPGLLPTQQRAALFISSPLEDIAWGLYIARNVNPWFVHTIAQEALKIAYELKSSSVNEESVSRAIRKLSSRRFGQQFYDKYQMAVGDSSQRELVLRLFAKWSYVDLPTSDLYPLAHELGVANPAALAKQLTRQEYGSVLVRPPYAPTASYGADLILGYIVISILVISGLWALVNSKRRKEMPERHPLCKALLKYGPLYTLVPEIDAEFAAANSTFGGATFTRNWVLSCWLTKSFVMRRDEIIWIYKKRTKHSVNFIPTGTSYALVLRDTRGKLLELSGSEQIVNSYLASLADQTPWVFSDTARKSRNSIRNNGRHLPRASSSGKQRWRQHGLEDSGLGGYHGGHLPFLVAEPRRKEGPGGKSSKYSVMSCKFSGKRRAEKETAGLAPATPRRGRPRRWLRRKYRGRRGLCKGISRPIPSGWPPGSGAPRGRSWPFVELWVVFRAA